MPKASGSELASVLGAFRSFHALYWREESLDRGKAKLVILVDGLPLLKGPAALDASLVLSVNGSSKRIGRSTISAYIRSDLQLPKKSRLDVVTRDFCFKKIAWVGFIDGPQRGTAATASLRACLDRNSTIKMTESSVRSLSVRGRHGLGFDLSAARSASEGAASGSLDGIKPIHFVPQGAASSDAAPPSQSLTGAGRANLRELLDTPGHGSDHLMVLVANLGNLDRACLEDSLNNFIASNWHIALLQEAAGTRWPLLAQARGLSVSVGTEAG